LAAGTETTPKRAKTGTTSALQSPSIKMWLKRGASEPASSVSDSSGEGATGSGSSPAKRRNLGAENDGKGGHTGKAGSAGGQSAHKGCSPQLLENLPVTLKQSGLTESVFHDGSSRSPKRIKIEFKNPVTSSPLAGSSRKSCKRKLTELEDESVNTEKRQRIDFDGVLWNEDIRSIDKENLAGKLISSKSVDKKTIPLQSLDSELNKSPNTDIEFSRSLKKGTVSPLNQSPVKNGNSLDGNVLGPVTPSRKTLIDWNARIYQSPTANLPNLVVDGPTTPVRPVVESSPKPKGMDWLTQMRIQKLSGHSPQSKLAKEKTTQHKQEENVIASPVSKVN